GQPIQIGLGEVPPETVSIGKPGRGALAHGIPLASGPYMKTRKGRNYGTSELVDLIRDAVDAVAERFPDSPALHIGDLSRRHGGSFKPHVSHQSGRDADVGYYMNKGHSPKGLQRVKPNNLDVERTWVLMESFLRSRETQYLFSERKLIQALFEHARQQPHLTDSDLKAWFPKQMGVEGKSKLRHLKGHDTHVHVRVYARRSRGDLDMVAGSLRSKLKATLAKAKETAGRDPDGVNCGGHATVPDVTVDQVAAKPNAAPSRKAVSANAVAVRPELSLYEVSTMAAPSRVSQRRGLRSRTLARMRAQQARARAKASRKKQREARRTRQASKDPLVPSINRGTRLGARIQ
ncbi:MAG: penicillin-insensitive murein endopeptidase, partial [Bradymonadia bacterium]